MKIIVLILFISCSNKYDPFIIKKNFKPSKKDQILITKLNYKKIQIKNKSDVVEDYNISKDSVRHKLSERFNFHLEEFVNKNFKTIRIHPESFQNDSITSDKFTNYRYIKHIIEDSIQWFYNAYVPDYKYIKLNYKDVRYILLIRNFSISREKTPSKTSITPNFGLTYTFPSGYLNVRLSYVVWDYKNDEAVIYGDSDFNEPFSFNTLKKSNWESVFQKQVKLMFKNNPFK